ncbi:MAG: homoserine dehydrogenase [Chloroflexi bacterium]|nr:homoserine dehydrogenase [Chloroflexota bacterium]
MTTASPAPPSSRRNRRAAQVSTRRRQRPTPSRRSAFLLIGAALLVLGAIPAFGYYEIFIAPMRETIVKVNDATFSMGDYVERLRIIAQQNKLTGGTTDMSTEPFRMLDTLRDSELIKQASPRYNVSVTEDEITAAIRGQLQPPKGEGEQATADELDRQYRELYRQRLSDLKVDEKLFRRITSDGIAREKMKDRLSDRVPAVADQLKARMVAVADETGLQAFKKRLTAGEDFGALAKELSLDEDTKKVSGDLGWLPRRVMDRQFDELVFKLEPNQLSDPILVPKPGGQDQLWLVQVLEKAVARQVEPKAREKLKERVLEDWLEEERKQNTVERRFDSEKYEIAITKVSEYTRPANATRLLGMGVVGGGVAAVLAEKAESLARQVGRPLELRRVLVRDLAKPRGAVDPALLTTEPSDVLADPAIAIVIEVMGGEHPALEYMRTALQQGKHVITANKEVIAKHGPELAALAQANGVSLYFEASVGGGIPLIAPFRQGLLANDITGIQAIINGTTNYILTNMSREGKDLPVALAEAQALGYAEADPANDVEGTDAAYKISILASLAFHTYVPPDAVYREGIMGLAARDFRYAKELGYAIKLLAIARGDGDSVQVRVHPAMLPEDAMMAKVDGVFNAVKVEGDLVGQVIFHGRGAGALPTTSAVLSDLLALAQDLHLGVKNRFLPLPEGSKRIRPMDELRTRYYLRLTVTDRPGVLAQIAQALGEHAISIASVIQKEVDEQAQTAELVIMTHIAPEAAMTQAVDRLRALPAVAEVGNLLRVEG